VGIVSPLKSAELTSAQSQSMALVWLGCAAQRTWLTPLRTHSGHFGAGRHQRDLQQADAFSSGRAAVRLELVLGGVLENMAGIFPYLQAFN
jgi:hypothetical protein